MPSKSGLFISYARRDGELAAGALRARLKECVPDLRVWQDRPEIEGGVGWWRQIEDALEHVEFLVIVMTPAVLDSEVTRREWRAARQSGVAVFPVKGPGFNPAAANIPRWMAKVHCYDLDVQWETFVAHLQRGAQPVRVPFMAPPLPADFVPRPRELDALKRLILTPGHGDPVAITTALAGAGGFGKTTLAAALCHDDDVLTAFDDGVLWATLGQTPNIQGELTRLYAALTGERPSFVSVEDAAQDLAERIVSRNCLIVVDDVWDPAHLKPFCRGGPGCARLVTTRQRMVAVDAKRVDVDEMSSDEAVSLLVARLPEQPALEPLRRLAHRLGEWPLLLKLAAGAMRQRTERGDSIAGALEYVGKALDRRGVTAFDRDSLADRRGAVASTIDIGLEQLSVDDRERCVQLAIFPEDVDIPIAAARELWGLDAFDTEETLVRLDNASLIDFDLRLGTASVHDVMRAYLSSCLPDGGRSAHARLIDAWGDLRALPHPYAWRWVVHHLQGAGRDTEIDRLLGNVTWLEGKLAASGIYALLDDFRSTSPDSELDVLAKALRLASHILARDPSQLVPQLLARLPSVPPSFSASLEGVAKAGGCWLRPMAASLSGPGGALVRILEAPGPIVGLTVSPAGDRIYACSDEGDFVAWETESGVETGAPEDWLSNHGSLAETLSAVWSSSLARLSDGRVVIGGSRGFAIWDPQTGSKPPAVVRVPEGVFSMAVAARSDRLLVGSRKGELRVWDVRTGEQLSAIKGHRHSIVSLAITEDGRIGLSGGYDKAARLWDLDSGELLDTLYELNEGIVYAVGLSPDGKLALTGAADGKIRVWDLPAGALRTVLAGHTHRVYALSLTPDGRHILSGSHDRTVKLWDLEAGELLRTFPGHADAVNAVVPTPDGRYAISGGKDRTVRLWQLDAGEVRAPMQQHDGWIHAVALAPDGSIAATAGQDGVLRLWDPASARVTWQLNGHHAAVRAVAFDTGGKRIVSGSDDLTLRVWDLATDASQVLTGPGDAINVLALTAGGTRALTGSLDGVAFLWNLERNRIERRWDAHRRAITFVAATAPGRVAVTGSTDGTLRVWDLARLKCFRDIPAHVDGVTAGALSPDARHLLSGGSDGTVRLWSFPACAVLATIDAHVGRVRSLQILPTAGLAVTAGYDRYVKVWRFPEMTLAASFATDSAVAAAAASDDGSLLVAGDAQGCAHFLRVEDRAFRRG